MKFLLNGSVWFYFLNSIYGSTYLATKRFVFRSLYTIHPLDSDKFLAVA